MIREIPNLQNDFINIQDHRYPNNIVMERNNNRENISFRSSPATVPERRSKHELRRSFSSQKRLMIPANYFGLESLILLVGLTASLLILPLILPPLPPPPFMLLLIPIGIMVLLVVLAFMPSSSSTTSTSTSNAKDVTCTFM